MSSDALYCNYLLIAIARTQALGVDVLFEQHESQGSGTTCPKQTTNDGARPCLTNASGASRDAVSGLVCGWCMIPIACTAVEVTQAVGGQNRGPRVAQEVLLIRSRLAPQGKRLTREIKTANGDFLEHRSGSDWFYAARQVTFQLSLNKSWLQAARPSQADDRETTAWPHGPALIPFRSWFALAVDISKVIAAWLASCSDITSAS